MLIANYLKQNYVEVKTDVYSQTLLPLPLPRIGTVSKAVVSVSSSFWSVCSANKENSLYYLMLLQYVTLSCRTPLIVIMGL